MAAIRSRFAVSEEDILLAEQRNSNRCAVARAIARQIPDASRIEVDVTTIRFTLRGERYVYVTPYRVGRYVVAYDAGDHVEPFGFTLRGDTRLQVHRKVTTDAGRDVEKTRTARRNAERKLKRVTAQAEAGKATRKAVAEAKAAVKDAGEAHTASKATKPGPTTKKAGNGTTRAPAALFGGREKKRSYGHRVLRENQGPGPLGDGTEAS